MKKINLDTTDEKIKEFFVKLEGGEEYVLERGGRPSFLLLSPKGREALKAELLSMLQSVWERNREIPEEMIDEEVQEAVKAIRTRYAEGRS